MSDKPKDPEKKERPALRNIMDIVIPGLPSRRGVSLFDWNSMQEIMQKALNTTESEREEIREWHKKRSLQRESARQQYEEQQADSSPGDLDEGEEPTP